MKKIPTLGLALIFGTAIESSIVVLSLLFADFGRDLHPNNLFSEFTLIVHTPGVIAARFLQPIDSHDFDYTIILSTSVALWSYAAFVAISTFRRLSGQKAL